MVELLRIKEETRGFSGQPVKVSDIWLNYFNGLRNQQKPLFINRSSQCSMTGVTKAVVCAILSVGCCI